MFSCFNQNSFASGNAVGAVDCLAEWTMSSLGMASSFAWAIVLYFLLVTRAAQRGLQTKAGTGM